MRPSLLFLFGAVACTTIFTTQSCRKSSSTPNIIDPYAKTGLPSNFYFYGPECFLYVGDAISFSPASRDFPDGSTFLWKFGDSTVSTEEFPTHVYSQGGNFTVTLIVNNNVVHDTSQTVQISPYRGSQYTSLMGVSRKWSGTAHNYIEEWSAGYNGAITDTPWAVQVVDSGTVTFLDGWPLHLYNIDTVNKYLYFVDCWKQRSLRYYYTRDSMVYGHTLVIGGVPVTNGNAEQISLHTP